MYLIVTHINILNDEEKIAELAAMLSGENVSGSALEHARQLSMND